MFTILDGTGGDVLAVEITGGYTLQDFEAFKQAFEAQLHEGYDKINILCKLDKLKISQGEWSAFVADGRYALSHIKQMRHVAVVADSTILEWLVKLDNALFGNPNEELVEKYFSVNDLDKAWTFVREGSRAAR